MVVVKIQGDDVILPSGSKVLKLFDEGFDSFCVFECGNKHYIYGQYFWSKERTQPLRIENGLIIGGREISGVKELDKKELERLLNSL